MRDGGEWGILLRVGERVPVRFHDDGVTTDVLVVDEQHFDPSAGAYERGWWCEDVHGNAYFVGGSGRVDLHETDGDEPGECIAHGIGAVIRVRERGTA